MANTFYKAKFEPFCAPNDQLYFLGEGQNRDLIRNCLLHGHRTELNGCVWFEHDGVWVVVDMLRGTIELGEPAA
jgi:hypothetical protein